MEVVTLDNILPSDNIEKKFQIVKSNVTWGRPQTAITYAKYIRSFTPKIYFRLDNINNTSYPSTGTTRDQFVTYTGTVNNIDSFIDSTVKAVNINGGYFTGTGFSLTNKNKGLFVSCWVRPETLSTTVDNTLFTKGVSYASTDYLIGCLLRYVSGKFLVVVKHGNNQESVQSVTTTTITEDNWYHIAINISSANKCDIYLNGEQVFTGSSTINCSFVNTSNCLIGVRTAPSTEPYIGAVSELVFREATLSNKTIRKLYQIGATKAFYEPDKDFDTAAFYSTLTQRTYTQFLNSTGAKYQWSLDSTDRTFSPPRIAENIAGLYMQAYGELATNGTSTSMISTLNGAGGSKKIFGDGNYAQTTGSGTWVTGASTWTGVTVSFVVKLTSYSGEQDGLLGYTGGAGLTVVTGTSVRQEPGFYTYVQGNRVHFTLKAVIPGNNYGNSQVVQNFTVSSTELQQNVPAFITFTLDTNGVATCYLNGQKCASEDFTPIKGILPPAASQKFSIGLAPNVYYQDIPTTFLDEILIWEKTLPLSDVINLYKIQKFGPFYENTVYNTNGTAILESYTTDNSPLPQLINEVDITKYVESYSIGRDLNNIVDSGQITYIDKWANTENLLAPGDYVIIREKYIDRTNKKQTDYIDVAHMKVEGSPAYEINATTKNRAVILRSLLAYLQDTVTTTISADVIKVSKTVFDLVQNIGTYRTYAVKNPNDTTRVYDTWAPYPAPKLWVTDFNNIGDSGDGGVITSTDQIRIKGSNGGIQIDYGSGTVYANTTYLTDLISKNGLGDPQTMYTEFYRYATPKDIQRNVVVTGIYYDIISDAWAIGLSRNITCDQLTVFVESGSAKGNMYKISQEGSTYKLRDINGYIASPLDEGLAIGDVIRIGDSNLGTDVLRKLLLQGGFQENDPTAPFYFELQNVPLELAPTVPTLDYAVENNTTQLDVLQQVLQYLPPDFKLIVESNGKVTGKLYGLNSLDGTAIELTQIVDTNQDNTDFGVVTKIIAEGQSMVPINVGLHQTYGGTSACRAYKLTNFALNYNSLNGTTLSQSAADTKLSEVFSGDPTIPVPTGTGWNYGNPSYNRHYGVIYNRFGDPTDVKRWEYEDTDFVAIDLGASSTGSPLLIDKMEFVWINHIIEGNAVAQSLEVYYMTAEDYEAEYGVALTNTANIADTSYFPSSTSKNWKVLIDEFSTTEGANTKTASDFTTGKPTQMRFVKLRIGQCQHRFKMQSGTDYDKVISRFSLTDVKIFTSLKITATAELGVTPPFNSVEHKKLASRYRRRTEYIPELFFLDTYDKAKDYAITQLQERFKEYAPYSISVFDPRVQPGKIVKVVNPETLVKSTYMVVATNSTDNFLIQAQLINYDVTI